MSEEGSEPRAGWLRLLLVVPFAAVLWVPFYNHAEPYVFGLPFFYAYQLLWVLLATGIIGLVYWAEHRE